MRTRVELTAPRQAASASFVHELTSGLPQATQLVVAVLDSTGRRGTAVGSVSSGCGRCPRTDCRPARTDGCR